MAKGNYHVKVEMMFATQIVCLRHNSARMAKYMRPVVNTRPVDVGQLLLAWTFLARQRRRNAAESCHGG